MTYKTFEECALDEAGTIYYDWEDSGFRVLVMRGPVSVNAYIGVPKDHPLSGVGYSDINISCHGGLTFAAMGGFGTFPADWYWFGWDYAHYGDAVFYDIKYGSYEGFPWNPDFVKGEAREVLDEFKDNELNFVLDTQKPK